MSQPRTRSECEAGPRPCPWTTCRYWLDRSPTCSLDVAAEGDHTLGEVAELMGMTFDRLRTLEGGALRHFRIVADQLGYHELKAWAEDREVRR